MTGGAPGGDIFASSATTDTTQTPVIPPDVEATRQGASQQIQGLQNLLPLTTFGTPSPRMTADLSNLQKFALGRMPSLSTVMPPYTAAMAGAAMIPELTSQPIPTPAGENAAIQQIQFLTGGPIGQSPATLAGMRGWAQNVLPQVEQGAMLSGLGNSGALIDAVSKSGTEAAIPLIAQEIENRKAMVPQMLNIAQQETARFLKPREDTVQAMLALTKDLTQLGQAMYSQQLSSVYAQMQGGQVTRDVAQQQADSAYEDYLRLQALSESVSTGIYGQLATAAIGTATRGRDVQHPSTMSDIGGLIGTLASIGGFFA